MKGNPHNYKEDRCSWTCSLCATDYHNYRLLTAVLFIRQVSTVVVSIADPSCWNTAARVSTLELIRSACIYSWATDDTLGPEISGFQPDNVRYVANFSFPEWCESKFVIVFSRTVIT